jgi:hypothetical protein
MSLNWKRTRVILLFLAIVVLGLWWIVSPRGTGPSWNNITVGRSTLAEVSQELGVPSRTEKHGLDTIFYYHDGPYDWAAHEISFRGNTVRLIREDMAVYDPRRILLSDFINRYGNPENVFWSKYGPDSRVLVFQDRGVLLEAMALPLDEAYIVQALYFRPCSSACVLIRFYDKLSPIDPFPNDDVGGERDPWGLIQSD